MVCHVADSNPVLGDCSEVSPKNLFYLGLAVLVKHARPLASLTTLIAADYELCRSPQQILGDKGVRGRRTTHVPHEPSLRLSLYSLICASSDRVCFSRTGCPATASNFLYGGPSEVC